MGNVQDVFKRPVLPETLAVGLICLLDLFSTVLFLVVGVATEANPLLAAYADHSVNTFIWAKLFLSFAPLAGLELCRQFQPKLVKSSVRLAALGYLAIYLTSLGQLNGWL